MKVLQILQLKKNTADLTIQEICETMNEHSYATTTLNNIEDPPQNMNVKTKSKFLRPFPEILLQNNFQNLKKIKLVFLPNGNLCKPVTIGGNIIHIKNTCGFDTIT